MLQRIWLAITFALFTVSVANAQTTTKGVGIVQQAAIPWTPSCPAGTSCMWVDTTNGQVQLYDTVATAAKTIPSIITATKGDLAAWTGTVWQKLAAGADGLCLTAQSGQTTGLLWASCGGGTTQTIDTINATAATGKSLTAAVADSGSNVGFILNNSTTLTGSTKLLSLRNNGTERLALQWDGSNDPVLYANPGSLNFTIKSASATSIRLDSGTSLVMPIADNSQRLGWTTAYWVSVHSRQYMTALGAQLTAAATITPTTGLQHVTGATTIDTIAATNFADNAQLTLLADGGTITWSAAGNIMSAGTVAQDKAQIFFYDATAAKWYPQSQFIFLLPLVGVGQLLRRRRDNDQAKAHARRAA